MSTQFSSGVIESREDFKDTPRGQYDYWCEEIKASQKSREKWHKQGDQIVKRYLDVRRGEVGRELAGGGSVPFKLNLFHSNITTLTSMLYGHLPQIDVSRRYADPNDDVSRVAAEIMERLLNNDVAENGEEVNCVLRSTLQDRLLPGLGCARVRYDYESIESEVEIDGELVMQEQVTKEDAPIDYYFWRDVLWSWGRSWAELTWIAYRSYMSRDEVEARFGEEAAKALEYKRQMVMDEDAPSDDPDMGSAWQKAEIWEIWDKVERKVVFLSKGYNKILETVNDPLGLSGFFPSPPFFMANSTTTLYTPTPDFHLAQDLYNEIDKLQTRIAIITEAVRVVGVYDSSAGELQRMFNEGYENRLIPVENWALFAEKGGIAGQIDWVPIADIVSALEKLREIRDDTIDLLYQVTGMADVLRGGGAGQYEGVGQAQLKAKFGSVRIQALQDEFATFAGNLMQLKAEVISRHFDPQTIAAKSNIGSSYDIEIAPMAIELIKNPTEARLKVAIRPESVAMVDYAQLKQERTEYINALSTYMQSAAPMIEQDPAMKPFLLQLLQWGLAGFKGSSEIEGVMDKAIDASQREAQNAKDKPDPEQQRAQMAMQLEQMKQKAKLAEIQAKAEADVQTRKVDQQADIETTIAEHRAKMAEIEAEMQATIAETQAKMEADILIEKIQAQANVEQTTAAAMNEVEKDSINTELEVGKEMAKTALKMDEIRASSEAKIREQRISDESGNSSDEND